MIKNPNIIDKIQTENLRVKNPNSLDKIKHYGNTGKLTAVTGTGIMFDNWRDNYKCCDWIVSYLPL